MCACIGLCVEVNLTKVQVVLYLKRQAFLFLKTCVCICSQCGNFENETLYIKLLKNNNSNCHAVEKNTFLQIQITLFFPEIVHNNYMGIYKMNHRITKCINSDLVEFNRGS